MLPPPKCAAWPVSREIILLLCCARHAGDDLTDMPFLIAAWRLDLQRDMMHERKSQRRALHEQLPLAG